MSSSRKMTALGAGLALLSSGLRGPRLHRPRPGQPPAGTGLVISEVYGGGGNSGATYTNDFIELYNPTASAVPLDGYTVQYQWRPGLRGLGTSRWLDPSRRTAAIWSWVSRPAR